MPRKIVPIKIVCDRMKNSQKKIGKESVHLCLQAINSEMRILLLLEFHVSYANKDTGKDKQMHRILFAN